MIQSAPTKRGRGSARDYIYHSIKDKIMSLELKPGTKISEIEMATLLQVSRTPVRESFLKLAQEDLLEIYPQSGTIVSLIDLEHVEEDRFMRESVERAIVRLACHEFTEELAMETNLLMQDFSADKRDNAKLFELDDQFHKILFEGCKKHRSWEMLHQMSHHFNRMRLLRFSESSLDWNIIISQHKEIFQLIKEKEPDEAEKRMVNHLRLALIEKEVVKKANPNFFK